MHLIPFFGSSLTPGDSSPNRWNSYRTVSGGRTMGACPPLQTINNDHIILKHCLNVAIRRGLLVSNPACKVPLPNPAQRAGPGV
jgi:hypothetical protein